MVYTKTDLDEFRQELIDLGFTDEEEMVKVLNTLDQLAEIGYLEYLKESKREKSDTKTGAAE